MSVEEEEDGRAERDLERENQIIYSLKLIVLWGKLATQKGQA